ncbi:DUF2637 domain-containing protein [Nocardia terpenica]|uniref:DUF2637 domain-containing protein n=1 Tax=Nocardia terpenica TaxID=455432 RepID=UPI001893EE97|nr:DUF2637 domain-containing protein [Nocardia terpenica]MBF6066047.1 DUF2637 domain-containing protein [Nocardia terpenica]MBF6109026.1 DUF2637 domain-containing protein [Nocardia terpenica]MBF6116291.1 DUF2637 domain-containing protein [Nocardia terpenica]MBF6123292.1 DUF2637 domain-containing protein [Nocardia terpenica]MBF6156525.1 DUF2637 domain-containing protein [Nocardia terpenica]
MTTGTHEGQTARRNRALWLQCACVTLVCVGAAYASYRHGREFAFRFGADETTAAIWPLIVDGLMMTATVELWQTNPAGHGRAGRGHRSAWLAFLFGITLSLCANIAAAPVLNVFAVAVAACPPLALLLSVELLYRALQRHRAETGGAPASETSETAHPRETAAVSEAARPETGSMTAEQKMWTYYQSERAKGRTPTGAELDRIAGTNNYGRRVPRRWRVPRDTAWRGVELPDPFRCNRHPEGTTPIETSGSSGILTR